MKLQEFVETYQVADAMQIMIWPVIICENDEVRGMGTWIQSPNSSRIITARHLFLRQGIWTAVPLPVGAYRKVYLKYAQQPENYSHEDVIILEPEPGTRSQIGPFWDLTSSYAAVPANRIEPINLRSNWSARKATLGGKAVRENGEQIYIATDYICRSGESGSGWIRPDGGIHVLLSGNTERTVFSRSIKLRIGPKIQSRPF